MPSLVPLLAVSADTVVAALLAAGAALWLVRRGVRAFRPGPGGGSCCGGARACPPSARDAEEVRAAAARVNRAGRRSAP